MTAMAEERPIFENEEWLVTGSGLEHKTTGYFIDRESLGQRRNDGLWTWPLHMAEKSWCAMAPFAEAFSCAAAAYGVETGTGLAQTFRIARCEVSPWPGQEKAAFTPAPLAARALRIEGKDPISRKPGSFDRSLNGQALQSSDDERRIRPHGGARPFATAAQRHPTRFGPVGATAFPWQAQHRIRKTGTKLVRLIQAAWNIR